MFKAIARLRQSLLKRRICLVMFYMRQEKAKHQEQMSRLSVELERLESNYDQLVEVHTSEVTP
ncbi:hypothetical protein G7047_19360 [Diaphorobacter sp. HDW4A]|uniref:hypothetical protein n=1 Tax=Diaphorobacter sp. HDW4A TaxID=2714924 RepID=UPI00140D1874|nr:hypothetical protein [Diaphorobacter sp. HDW4A]QIL81834.1 hypothetical protein G7047_19360 [Diaphorobacter sp. HDW4A]